MPRQLPLIKPDSDWLLPDGYPDLSAAEYIVVDCETYDPMLFTHGPGWPFTTRDGHIAGVAVATDDLGFVGYFPMRHVEGGNLDAKQTLLWLKEELGRENQPKLFANALYDCGWLRREGVSVKGPWWDVQIAAPLIDEERQSYSLDNLAKDYTTHRKDEWLLREAGKTWGLKNIKGQMHELPSAYVGPYAEGDVIATRHVWEALHPILSKERLWQAYNLEIEILPLLIEMRARGVRVDVDGAQQLGKLWLEQQKKVEAEIKRRWCEVDIWSAESVARAFEMAGVSYQRTKKKGAPSFEQPWLERHEHDLPQLMLQARKLSVARNTFIEKAVLGHEVNGRIHCQLHPMRKGDDEETGSGGTVTGRFSSSDPNLQQVPKRGQYIGPAVRQLYLPEAGCQWVDADYSQQEPRLMVHFACASLQPGWEDAQYALRSGLDFHSMAMQLFARAGASLDRDQSKIVNLAIMYGMGTEKLAKALGSNFESAKQVKDAYLTNLPFVDSLKKDIAKVVRNRGYIISLMGRRGHFNHWERNIEFNDRDNHTWEPPVYGFEAAQAKWPEWKLKRAFQHKALNKLIQMSAAYQTKAAMAALWREGIMGAIQVHDELCFTDIPNGDDETPLKIKQIMEDCVPLLVPSLVEVTCGTRWKCTSSTELPWLRRSVDGGALMQERLDTQPGKTRARERAIREKMAGRG